MKNIKTHVQYIYLKNVQFYFLYYFKNVKKIDPNTTEKKKS